MSEVKRGVVPLHERIQQGKENSAKYLEDSAAKTEEISQLYRSVFETKEGEAVLEHLVSAHLSKVPSAVATPNEIMFQHGQQHIVHTILNRIKRGEK